MPYREMINRRGRNTRQAFDRALSAVLLAIAGWGVILWSMLT